MSRYGPHDPSFHEGRMMRVTLGSHPRNGRPAKFGPFREFDQPLPAGVLAQIAALNTLAHEDSLTTPVAPELRVDVLGLSRFSGRCSHGFDVKTQHPQLCPCHETGHE